MIHLFIFYDYPGQQPLLLTLTALSVLNHIVSNRHTQQGPRHSDKYLASYGCRLFATVSYRTQSNVPRKTSSQYSPSCLLPRIWQNPSTSQDSTMQITLLISALTGTGFISTRQSHESQRCTCFHEMVVRIHRTAARKMVCI